MNRLTNIDSLSNTRYDLYQNSGPQSMRNVFEKRSPHLGILSTGYASVFEIRTSGHGRSDLVCPSFRVRG
jgi:hypothetical protein